LWPVWGVDLDGRPYDLGAAFGERPVVLEIGSGMGEAAAQMAAAQPEVGLLAVDVHTPGLGALLRAVEAAGLANVRVGRGDAVELLRDMLPPACLAGVRVFFPDPWPKARHHKRRLIQPAFAVLAGSRIRPGGFLHLATDWAPYAEQMREVLGSCELFEPATAADVPLLGARPETRFERAGRARGHTVTDLVYRRP
jgi:tRNA (guanine-N7-)-methyltransferase